MTDTTETPKATGIVLYCDGSVKPNPGKIGYGLHGFQYSFDVPKKGSGNSDYTLTPGGYHKNDPLVEKPQAVTPLTYFDGFVATQTISTNNAAELWAARQAIDVALSTDAKTVLLKSDSQYVIEGIKKYSHGWIRNRWMRDDGTPVKNAPIWKGLLADINNLTTRGVKFDITWVKGHSDVFGNLIADKLAGIGSANSRMGQDKVEITRSGPEGYWKENNERNPLLNQRCMYFNTLRNSQERGEYFLGNHGKEDDFLGKKDPETAFACVYLRQPEVPLELIREYQSSITGDFDTIVILRMDALYTKNRTKDLENYGIATLYQPSSKRIDLAFHNDEPLTKGMHTPKLAMRAINELSKLKVLRQKFQDAYVDPETIDIDPENHPFRGYGVTEVTKYFYEDEAKVVKGTGVITKKLFDTIVVGHKTITTKVDCFGTERDLKLQLGHDMPDRNALKRIEGSNPKIFVLLWKESEQFMRYATAIVTDDGHGVWSGVYSNLVVLPK